MARKTHGLDRRRNRFAARLLLPTIDGRTKTARRFASVYRLYVTDMGGEESGISEGAMSLARRAAALTVECERLEAKFAEADGASKEDLDVYQRATNTLKRLLETLNITLERKPRNVTPTLHDYVRNGRQRITIDHDDHEDAHES